MKLINREQIAGMNLHYLFYSLDYFLDAQAEVGIKTIELWGGAPHFYIDTIEYQDCKSVRKKLKDRDLEIKVLTPENCIYQYQVAAQTPDLFEKSFKYFSNGIKAASELGCKIMEINSGWGYWNEDREEAWKRSREMLSRLAEVGSKHDVTLAMESLRPEESNLVTTLKDAKRMFDEVNHPNLKAMIDITGISVAGETVDQWFEVFGDNIIHTHFIDCKPYGHLVWGDGDRDMEELLKSLDKNGYTGYLGQELTEFKYYKDPKSHDERNMKSYEPYIK